MEEYTQVSDIKKLEGWPLIFRLDNDILWYIFSLNADMEQETEERIPALLTLRYTSQVCSHWRDLAIGSPSLWARVLNVQTLNQTGDGWRNEVIRRTGTALLHIRAGDNEVWRLNIMAFLVRILDEHWKRIQSLHLRVNIDGADRDRWRRLFERPAPSLEVFRFSDRDRREINIFPSDFALFANTAPLLRTISAAHMKLNLGTIGAPNLRYLVLHPSVSGSDLLRALSHMPLLERLEASMPSYRDIILGGKIEPSLPQVSLPRLRDIRFNIYLAVDTTLSLLAHIRPANNCALDFIGLYRQQIPDQQSVTLYGMILSAYSRYNTELASATNLSANFTRTCASLLVSLPLNRRFKFHLVASTEFPEQTISTFLSSFTTHPLINIKTLTLFIKPIEPILSNPDVFRFILALGSVKTLHTNPQTLEFIRKVQFGSSVLPIPALTAIHLAEIHEPDDISLILDFLNDRVTMGPVDTLTMTIGLRTALDISALKSFPGLTIESQIIEKLQWDF